MCASYELFKHVLVEVAAHPKMAFTMMCWLAQTIMAMALHIARAAEAEDAICAAEEAEEPEAEDAAHAEEPEDAEYPEEPMEEAEYPEAFLFDREDDTKITVKQQDKVVGKGEDDKTITMKQEDKVVASAGSKLAPKSKVESLSM